MSNTFYYKQHKEYCMLSIQQHTHTQYSRFYTVHPESKNYRHFEPLAEAVSGIPLRNTVQISQIELARQQAGQAMFIYMD